MSSYGHHLQRPGAKCKITLYTITTKSNVDCGLRANLTAWPLLLIIETKQTAGGKRPCSFRNLYPYLAAISSHGVQGIYRPETLSKGALAQSQPPFPSRMWLACNIVLRLQARLSTPSNGWVTASAQGPGPGVAYFVLHVCLPTPGATHRLSFDHGHKHHVVVWPIFQLVDAANRSRALRVTDADHSAPPSFAPIYLTRAVGLLKSTVSVGRV